MSNQDNNKTEETIDTAEQIEAALKSLDPAEYPVVYAALYRAAADTDKLAAAEAASKAKEKVIEELRAQIDMLNTRDVHYQVTNAAGEKIVMLDYPAAARAIALWLKPFCEESLPYPDMIAEAARKQVKAYERLQALLREARDTVQASTAESGITESRRQYRADLHQRLSAALAAAEAASKAKDERIATLKQALEQVVSDAMYYFGENDASAGYTICEEAYEKAVAALAARPSTEQKASSGE